MSQIDMKRIVFIRTDANGEIGAGHLMRCMSVANALLSYDFNPIFLTADHNGDKLLEKNGMPSICLNRDWSDLDKEIGEIAYLIKEKKPSLLITDSYYVTNKYFDLLSEQVPIAYFDDINTCVWNVDFLINYNIVSSIYDYSAYNNTRTKLLLGSKYAPLREEFQHVQNYVVSDNVTKVLVSTGGADPDRITERIIRNICPQFKTINFHFLIGTFNTRLDDLKQHVDNNVILHVNEREVSRLMQECDIVIAAAGSTLYELCACGIPTIVYSLADNQIVATKEFARREIMLSAGDSRTNTNFERDVSNNLKLLVDNKKIREDLSKNMTEIVDGKGAFRLTDTLINNIIDDSSTT